MRPKIDETLLDLRPLARAASATAGSFGDTCQQPVTDRSQYTVDRDAAERWRTATVDDPHDHMVRHIFVRVAAVHEHLRALQALFREPYSAVSTEAVARSLIETALAAAWVLEPGDADGRVARALAVSAHDAGEACRLAESIADPRPEAALLRERHLIKSSNYRDRIQAARTELGVETTRKPSATELFSGGLATALPAAGTTIFFQLSGSAHGRPSGLLQTMDPDQGSPGMHRSSKALAWPTWRAAEGAADVLISAGATYFGWPVEPWQREVARSREVVARADRAARLAFADARRTLAGLQLPEKVTPRAAGNRSQRRRRR